MTHSIFQYKTIVRLCIMVLGVMIAFYGYRQSLISAESAFLESLAENSPLTQIEFYGVHDAPAPINNILFFSWKDAKNATVQHSYVPVKRSIFGNWRVGSSGKCNQDDGTQANTELSSFHAHYLWKPYDYNSMSDISILCGHINKAEVQKIAVTWQDGTIARDSVKEDHFVVFASQRQQACELQLLDESNVLIQTIDLTKIDFISSDVTTPLPSCGKLSNG